MFEKYKLFCVIDIYPEDGGGYTEESAMFDNEKEAIKYASMNGGEVYIKRSI